RSRGHPSRHSLGTARKLQRNQMWYGRRAMPDQTRAAASITRLLDIMDKLRDPGGCPWDREQSLRSLTPYLLEEAHEVIEGIETEERKEKGEERSAIGGVPASLPALVRAERLTEKAGAVGFDWPDAKAVLAKVREELAELTEAIDDGVPSRIEDELGDLLFA